MSTYSLGHLTDHDLLCHLAVLVTDERKNTAALLAHIAEVDARKLYLLAACSSMHSYCVERLGLAEDSAYKRIAAARAARRHPAIFDAIADGRLHLSAVVMLAPQLGTQCPEAADELIAEAAHRSKAEIELLLVRRRPRPDVLPSLAPIAEGPALRGALAPDPADGGAPKPVTRTRPLAPERFALQVTIDQATHDKLVRAQAFPLPAG